MDNLDALMSKVSIKKEKPKKDDNFTNNSRTNSILTNNSTLASSPKSYEDNEYGLASPKTPVFKPQQTPNDMIPDMLLPVSELNSEIADEEDQDFKELDSFVTKKPKFRYSCPTGPTLDIWVGNSTKDYNFEMIEESEAEMLNLDEGDVPIQKKPGQNTGFNASPKKKLGDSFAGANRFESSRQRSQSENITGCTIFKFMELGKNLSLKRNF